MPDFFLPGPFAEDDFLATIVGPEAAVRRGPRTSVVGLALRTDPHGPAAALVDAAGGRVDGALFHATEFAAARLRFALTAFGGATFRRVETGAGPAEAAVVRDGEAPAAAWPASPDPEWRAHLLEAAAEAMAHFGRRPAAEMPALMHGIGFRALARARGRADRTPVLLRRDLSTAADVEELGVAYPYARYFGVEEHRLRHRRFGGGMSAPVERAVFTSGDAVTVLPFDPARRLVLMIEQFRPGPYARRDPRPWSLEAVAGRCDPGEGPEATARREAVEEAGLTLGRVRRIASYYTSPGTMAEHITAYVGEASLDGAGGIHGLATEDEDIRVIVATVAEALAVVEAGEVNNGPLLVSLLWLGANEDRLVAEWSRGPADVPDPDAGDGGAAPGRPGAG
ncbi:NUDIX domain-containing protein [Amaricoccus sp.]|uniref:NUDIX domain-containing protein n=1 Tax=Amaricoccus sp. TaxID=1872485 RepID=UPI001B56342A|nr:NUDIX domain-containing protein [Amaricoccus sp.]MBP7242090.1 NUDIX domain-containing protein [Amaricoccus sp.]